MRRFMVFAMLTAGIGLPACTGAAVGAEGTIVGRLMIGHGAALPSGDSGPITGIASQRVTIVDTVSGAVVAETLTASDGSFALAVPSGSYLLQAASLKQYVRVTAGEQVRLNLMMPTP